MPSPGSSRRIRTRVAAGLLLSLAACETSGALLTPRPDAEPMDDAPRTEVVPVTWIPTAHPLGKGRFRIRNVVSLDPLVLSAPAGTFEGAEVHSDVTLGLVDVEARLECPDRPGILCTLFFYQQAVGHQADEIDIEIAPEQGLVGFTVWRDGVQIWRATRPWTPGSRPLFAIRRLRHGVRFEMEGQESVTWERDVPLQPMSLYASIWWPTWLSGGPDAETLVYRVWDLRVLR